MSYLKTLLGEAYREGMTEEEISNALESMQTAKESAVNDPEVIKLKNAISKANSEAARYKKQLEERMSAEEKEKANQKEAWDKLVEDNQAMRKQITITENKAKLLGIGYTAELAQTTAEAMFNNDWETIINAQKTMFENREKAVRADVLKETPVPPAGNSSAGISKAQFDSMSTTELMELYQNDPALYEKLYNEK